MALEDPTDRVVVLRAHLEEWEDALRRVHGYCNAHDLMDCYRTGSAVKTSRVTRMTAQAINRITGYLHGMDELHTTD